MEIKKQVPSITVNIRVPEPLNNRLEALILRNIQEGKKVSKNSIYVDALSMYIDMLDDIGEGVDGKDGLVCSVCGKKHLKELAINGIGLIDLNGKMLCLECLSSKVESTNTNIDRFIEMAEELGQIPIMAIEDEDLENVLERLKLEGFETELDPKTDYLICIKKEVE